MLDGIHNSQRGCRARAESVVAQVLEHLQRKENIWCTEGISDPMFLDRDAVVVLPTDINTIPQWGEEVPELVPSRIPARLKISRGRY